MYPPTTWGNGAAGSRRRLAAPARRDGQFADGLPHVAGKRVNGRVGAERQREVAPRLDRVHGDHLIGAGKAGQLHGHLTDSAQPEHCHAAPQPDIALAQRQGHDQGIEANGRLWGQARRQQVHAAGLDRVSLADWQVSEDPITHAELGHGRPHLRHDADGHIAQGGRLKRLLRAR